VGRRVESGEEVLLLAPDLADALSAVRVAESDRERQAVFEFRYSVYVEELKRGVGTVDARRARLHDPDDDEPGTTLLYTAGAGGSMTGTARVRSWAPGAIPGEVAERFSTESFTGIADLGTAELGRLMVRADRRGRSELVSLLCAVYLFAETELGTDLVFLTCLSGLVRYYRRVGFRSYAADLVPTSDGVTVPMVLILSDRPYLDRVGSFLAPLAGAFYAPGKHPPLDVRRWSDLLDGRAAPVELDPAAVWERVQRLAGVTGAPSRFFDALDADSIRKLSDCGFVMAVEAGQLLTKKGLVQREMFVVLDGTFEIHDGDRRIGVVGPGEVIGEIGFFGTAQQRSASVTALAPGHLLVLRRHWLDELRRSDPERAADILFQLARALADHVSAPSPSAP